AGFELLPAASLFIFNQETAYEVFTRLEFRRVLFRSQDTSITLTLPPPPVTFSGVLRDGSGAPVDGAYVEVENSVGSGYAHTDARSEERRVGKGWSSRWCRYP